MFMLISHFGQGDVRLATWHFQFKKLSTSRQILADLAAYASRGAIG